MTLSEINNITETTTLDENYGFILNRNGKIKQYTSVPVGTFKEPYILSDYLLSPSGTEGIPENTEIVDKIRSGNEILIKISNSIILNPSYMTGVVNGDNHYIMFAIPNHFSSSIINAAVKIPESDVAKWPFDWISMS